MSGKTNVVELFPEQEIRPAPEPERMYRLYTEDVGTLQTRRLLRALAEHYALDGLTAYKAQGIWQGKFEPSLVIAMTAKATPYEASNDLIPLTITGAANFILGFLNQSAVGIERPDGRFELVYSELGVL